ncbi:endonuclease/exonuclease/phosphatase family protein [Niabella aurantiaca]|uniref:endonuclease/exonuclease/phosphatase family protein n=1 Tax=Niabella aurantiaca TaxID=379900 RepID=UPI00037E73D1|nr:endonuclease/exonuclease/phosphatase family protein [Niabella aurantiaca]
MKRIRICLLLCALVSSAICGAQNTMRFITYNLLQGMKRDSANGKPVFTDWVRKMKPDVLALQEVTGFTQAGLESMAAAYGHPYAVLLIEGEKYPVAITSKYPIINVRRVYDNMDRGFIVSEVAGYQTVVVHLTPFDYRKRQQEIALLLAEVNHLKMPGKWVLMGDFNTVSPQDSLAYQDGRLAEAYRRYEQKYAPILKLNKDRLDYSVIQRVLDNGFSDVLKLKNAAFHKTVHPKAFEPKTGPDIPSRIDFIFVSNALLKKVGNARVITDGFTDHYSDHYPVCLDLEK